MSRTYKDKGHHSKLVRNAFIQKIAREWADDFGGTKGKHKDISRRVRRRLKREEKKEMKKYESSIVSREIS